MAFSLKLGETLGSTQFQASWCATRAQVWADLFHENKQGRCNAPLKVGDGFETLGKSCWYVRHVCEEEVMTGNVFEVFFGKI